MVSFAILVFVRHIRCFILVANHNHSAKRVFHFRKKKEEPVIIQRNIRPYPSQRFVDSAHSSNNKSHRYRRSSQTISRKLRDESYASEIDAHRDPDGAIAMSYYIPPRSEPEL